jgi:alcohol dehydrogenase class IV
MGASPAITAACGMDALTQLVEPLTSLHATAVTDALAVAGIEAVGRSLQRAVENGYGLDARTEMAYAALLSGICLSSAGLGAVHGLASPVSAHAPVPHGHICAVLLPLVTAANLQALRAGRGRQEALRGYERAEAALGAPIPEFCGRFKIRGFGSFGLKAEDLPRVVAGATSGSMMTNPVELTPQELEDLLRAAL